VTVVGGVRVPRADDIPANPAPPAPQPEPVALP
jgi:hypothetical protein